jgi:hypothetical protein
MTSRATARWLIRLAAFAAAAVIQLSGESIGGCAFQQRPLDPVALASDNLGAGPFGPWLPRASVRPG